MDNVPHKRRWFQFRLRTLLVMVTLVSVGLGWLAYERQKVRVRCEWLKKNDDLIASFYIDRIRSDWVRWLLGDESRIDPAELYWTRPMSRDDRMQISKLTEIRSLEYWYRDTKDADLECLRGLTQLTSLRLCGAKITDAGLVHLEKLVQLERLDLSETQISDSGLRHLYGLIKLKELDLTWTNEVTDTGVQQLQRALPNTTISK